MAQAIKNPKISFRTTALVLVTTFLVVGAFEIKALKAYEEKKIGYRKVGAEYCISCHKDAKTIRRMREKEDGVGDLSLGGGNVDAHGSSLARGKTGGYPPVRAPGSAGAARTALRVRGTPATEARRNGGCLSGRATRSALGVPPIRYLEASFFPQ